MDTAIFRLFAYGTLLSRFNSPLARKLRGHSKLEGAGTVAGSIYRLEGVPWPGYRPQPAGIVHGEIYRLNDPASLLPEFDSREGEEYTRIGIAILSGPGSGSGSGSASGSGAAWIYRFDGLVEDRGRILSGDFLNP